MHKSDFMYKLNCNNKNVRVLFISPCLPYPLNDGLRIRAFNTIKELLKQNYDITLLCFAKEEDAKDIQKLKVNLDINIINVKLKDLRFYSFYHIFYSIFSRYPFYVKFSYTQEFKEKLKSLISNHKFDLIYIFDRSMILYGVNVPDMPKIFDSVDSQSLNSLSGFKSSENIFHKIFWYISYIKSKKLEKSVYNSYQYVITAAERDAEQLKNLTNSKVISIPNGIDLDHFKPLNLEKIPYSLTFMGTMDAFSNQQAVLYFVEHIYPIIKKEIPHAKLFVIGKNPPKKILKLNDGVNIFIIGYIENIQPYLDKSEIIISPLKMASGIQNKILVAMAMNKTIVATKESIGELNKVISNKDIIKVNNNQKFAEEVTKLFFNRSLLNEIGRNGRKIVKENYSWESLGYKIDKLIKNILD